MNHPENGGDHQNEGISHCNLAIAFHCILMCDDRIPLHFDMWRSHSIAFWCVTIAFHCILMCDDHIPLHFDMWRSHSIAFWRVTIAFHCVSDVRAYIIAPQVNVFNIDPRFDPRNDPRIDPRIDPRMTLDQ